MVRERIVKRNPLPLCEGKHTSRNTQGNAFQTEDREGGRIGLNKQSKIFTLSVSKS